MPTQQNTDSAMFILNENQQQHLLVILNEINRYIYESAALAAKNQPTTTTTTPTPVTGFDLVNRQSLVEFIINTHRFFQSFFKFSSRYHTGPETTQPKWKELSIWMSSFYNEILLKHLDFEQLFDDSLLEPYQTNRKDFCAKSKVILNGTTASIGTNNNSNNNTNQNLLEKTVNNLKELSNSQPNAAIHMEELVSRINVLHDLHLPSSNQIYQQTLSNLNNELNNTSSTSSVTSSNLPLSQLSFSQLNIPQLSNLDPKLAKDANNILGTVEQQCNTLNYQMIKDLRFLSILIAVLLYKLRNLFPSLVTRYEGSWKFLVHYERELESSFMHTMFSDFLQNELLEQRETNRKRTDALKQEVTFLEKMSEQMEKEVEAEIYRLVQLQNRSNKMPPLLNAISRTQQQQQSQSNLFSNVPLTMNSVNFPSGKISPDTKGSRPCPDCGKLFRNAYKLNRHLYVHKDPSEKPYMCEWESCNYRSISRNDLNRHKMIHTGEKPYLCEIEGCEKRYSRADKLRHHKISVHFKDISKKEQVCIWPGCNFQCFSKNELNRHQLTHETVKCDYIGCEKMFDKVDKLKRHREKDHSKSTTDLSTEFPNNFQNNQQHQLSLPHQLHSVAAAASMPLSAGMQHVMLPASSANNLNSIQGLTAVPNASNKMGNTSSTATNAGLSHHISATSEQQRLNSAVIAAAASNPAGVPISVVANAHQQPQRQNTIAVWSS